MKYDINDEKRVNNIVTVDRVKWNKENAEQLMIDGTWAEGDDDKDDHD